MPAAHRWRDPFQEIEPPWRYLFFAAHVAGVPVATGGSMLGRLSLVEALGFVFFFVFFFVFLEDLVFFGSSLGSIGAFDSLSSSSLDEDVR